ncbi:MAG: hypothetical protein NTW10_13420 [Bacteroidetes bacterium]|nr:hypothetical protein [Bacteroidota bacterium]
MITQANLAFSIDIIIIVEKMFCWMPDAGCWMLGVWVCELGFVLIQYQHSLPCPLLLTLTHPASSIQYPEASFIK